MAGPVDILSSVLEDLEALEQASSETTALFVSMRNKIYAIAKDEGRRVPIETAKPALMKEPPKIAFLAYALYQNLGNQNDVANQLRDKLPALIKKGVVNPRKRTQVTQGDVSRWCSAVRKWRGAGQPMPTPEVYLKGKAIQFVDPDVLDLGARRDHRPPRQREKRDPDSPDDWD